MKKLLACIAISCLLSVPAHATGSKHSHTCQGGHNCNTGGTDVDLHIKYNQHLYNKNMNTNHNNNHNNNHNTNKNLNVNNNHINNHVNNNSKSSSKSSATANNTNTVTNTATGGNSTSNSTAMGGNSKAVAKGGQGGNGGMANNNVTVDASTNVPKPPVNTAYAAPLTSADDTCMGSSSVGGQSYGFGLSLGTTWEDEDCRRRKNARFMHNMGNQEIAITLMCEDDEVFNAVMVAGTPEQKRLCQISRGITVTDVNAVDENNQATLDLPNVKKLQERRLNEKLRGTKTQRYNN